MSSPHETETPQEIIREVLPLTRQRRIDPAILLGLADRLGIHDCEPRIYFLRELTGIVRELPVKGFDSPEGRLRLIDALQQALDDAVEAEEEEIFES